MSEEFWTRLVDHCIQAIVTVMVASITASPALVLAWVQLKKLKESQELNAKSIAQAASKAAEANKVAVAAVSHAQEAVVHAEEAVVAAKETAAVAKDVAAVTVADVQSALTQQTQELKEAIKGNT